VHENLSVWIISFELKTLSVNEVRLIGAYVRVSYYD